MVFHKYFPLKKYIQDQDDGISYGNKQLIQKGQSDATFKRLAASPRLASTALEVIYKKRKELEAIELQSQLVEWFELNFGKKSLLPVANLQSKRKKAIQFVLERNSIQKNVYFIKEGINSIPNVI